MASSVTLWCIVVRVVVSVGGEHSKHQNVLCPSTLLHVARSPLRALLCVASKLCNGLGLV